MFLDRLLMIGLLGVLLYLASPSPAYAYLDPGTSSYVLQMLVAALVGGAFVIRMFWDRIKIFFGGLFSREEKLEETDD